MQIVITVIAFLVLFFLALGLFVVLYATTRRDRTELFKASTVAPSGRLKYREEMQRGVDWFNAQSFDTLRITSYDGLKLEALLLVPPKPAASMVALHGFRSWPAREFAGVVKTLYDNGVAVLYPYQRAHRNSEGRFITFGIKEKQDLAQWASLMAGKFPGLPMYLYGQSMGGATVLMSGRMKLPEQIKGFIADSAYSSPVKVIANILKQAYHIPAYPLTWFINLWTVLLARYSLYRNRAEDCMRADSRYLFIHGDEDDLIPYHMGRINFEKCPSPIKSFLTVEKAGHCACCYKSSSEYIYTLLNFMNIKHQEDELLWKN